MSYTAVAYTTQDEVARIMRTHNKKISFGDDDKDTMSPADVLGYIKDASAFIDATIRKTVEIAKVPLTTTYPEITYSAPRMAAFLIYRSLYQGYRWENIPMGPRGWIEDAKDMLKTFVENINEGCYPTLSPSVGGPGWVGVEKFFINKFGISSVHAQVGTAQNQVTDIDSDNMAPREESQSTWLIP